MKWKNSYKGSVQGDRRIKRKFALFPTCCGDYIVWLETYKSIQEYRKRLRATKFGGMMFASWDEIERRAIVDEPVDRDKIAKKLAEGIATDINQKAIDETNTKNTRR